MQHSAVGLALVFTAITIARSDGVRLLGPGEVYAAQAARQQTEADKRFAELVKTSRSGNTENPTGVLEQLQRFAVDYPNDARLDTFVYPAILVTLFKIDPARAETLADEFLAKFPDKPFLRFRAYETKFSALEAQKNYAAIRALGQRVLETETRPDILERAADYDSAGALRLLDKAIAERLKHPRATEPPTLADLRWSYARSLERAGRTGESLKLAIAVIDETTQAIADLSLSESTDQQRSDLEYLQEVLADRYQTFVRWCTDAGRRELAVQYLARQEGLASRLQSRAHIETSRAALFDKLGRPDLALDCLVRAFTERMEQATYDTIATLAQKVGRAADAFYARGHETSAIVMHVHSTGSTSPPTTGNACAWPISGPRSSSSTSSIPHEARAMRSFRIYRRSTRSTGHRDSKWSPSRFTLTRTRWSLPGAHAVATRFPYSSCRLRPRALLNLPNTPARTSG